MPPCWKLEVMSETEWPSRMAERFNLVLTDKKSHPSRILSVLCAHCSKSRDYLILQILHLGKVENGGSIQNSGLAGRVLADYTTLFLYPHTRDSQAYTGTQIYLWNECVNRKKSRNLPTVNVRTNYLFTYLFFVVSGFYLDSS